MNNDRHVPIPCSVCVWIVASFYPEHYPLSEFYDKLSMPEKYVTVLSNIVSDKENQTTANIQGPDKECTLDISL